jgi:hypothetical protein
MEPRARSFLALATAALLWTGLATAEPVIVRHVEGLVHDFLSLRSPGGDAIAEGELIQNAQGDRVTSRVVFHFKDGSLYDQTAIFSQRGHFQLISYQLVQKGPAFERSLDMMIDCATGHVTVAYENERGEEQVEDEHMDLPADLANGLVPVLLKNVQPDALPTSLTFVVPTPEPRLVKITVTVAGTEPFSVAGSTYKATHYVLKVDIGGIAGLIASLVGKLPPDSHLWILEGVAPAFLRSQSPMFLGGPIWQMDIVGPVWPGER